jgi:hypothetical protein
MSQQANIYLSVLRQRGIGKVGERKLEETLKFSYLSTNSLFALHATFNSQKHTYIISDIKVLEVSERFNHF